MRLSFILSLFALFAPPYEISAQNFQPANGPVATCEVGFNEAVPCFIYFENLTMDTLRLRWRRIEVKKPESWIMDLCDYGACYVGIPANANMNPAPPQDKPYLKLVVQPGTEEGSAWVWFRALNRQNEAEYYDVYFSLHTPGFVATAAPQPGEWQAWPNPASGHLWISHPNAQVHLATLHSVEGRLVASVEVGPGTTAGMSLSGVPPGFYYLQMNGFFKKIIVQP
ncbi:MAG: hypothetical protein ACK4NS_00585 [Saprospiraceae bacterium]